MPHLPLDSMSVEEKLQAMDELWSDLRRRHSDAVTPEWHQRILKEREAAEARGEIIYEDLGVVEAKIRQKMRESPPRDR